MYNVRNCSKIKFFLIEQVEEEHRVRECSGDRAQRPRGQHQQAQIRKPN